MPRPALLTTFSIALLWALSQLAVAQQPASGAYQKEGRNKGFPDGGVDPAAFAAALGLGAGLVSQVNVPQTLVGSTADYHFRSGFDGGLRFNYGSYRDFVRPDLNGKLRSYTVFFGRAW